jgi:hypothetical protein
MANAIVNYDGSITCSPQQVVYPETVEDIQAVLRDGSRYPSPVRAMGSFHSLTPCVASDGTVVNMSHMNRIVDIDKTNLTFTAQGGLQQIDAARALRQHDLQFMLNIEIGNMTLGSAACCHTKDALDGIELGQVASYVTGMKWVTPGGDLAEASESVNPELLAKMRSSYGMAGVVYEVTFRVKPIEAIHLTYHPRPVDELTEKEVDELLDGTEGLICWTVGRTCVFQRRQRIAEPGILESLQAAARQALWNFGGAHVGHFIDQFVSDADLREGIQRGWFDVLEFLYGSLRLFGGITLLAPDKTIDYRNTPAEAKYAFTFWAFPRGQWLKTLREYLDFADRHFQATGFRCNMPVGAYHIRRDTKSILSYSYDQEIFSIDPIHAVTDLAAWQNFLRAFNEFAYQRNGVPLLNQSPFVERKHLDAAYGRRWADFCEWVKGTDPGGRLLNPFFKALIEQRAASSAPVG